MSFEVRIQELGLTIPEPPKPAGHFVPAVRVGNLLFVSGQIPTVSGQVLFKGKLGRDLSLEQGQEAARQALRNALAAIRSHTGTLDSIKPIAKLNGRVPSAEAFNSQPQGVSGASLLLSGVFVAGVKHPPPAL